jgi:hypothetical protein
MVVIAVGDAFNGIWLVGPFDGHDAAGAYAEMVFKHDEWHLLDVRTPEPELSADELDDCSQDDPTEFTESAAGHDARERWAKRYDELNGAPEGDGDR